MLDLKIIGGSTILVILVYIYTEEQKLWLQDDTTEQISNQANF